MKSYLEKEPKWPRVKESVYLNLCLRSPVPITEMSQKSLRENYGREVAEGFDLHGLYFNKYSAKPLSIAIWDKAPNYIKINTLVHEIGHAICDSKNCECVKMTSRQTTEYHAIDYELSTIKCMYPKLFEFTMFKNMLIADDTPEDYFMNQTCHKIMKSKKWKKDFDDYVVRLEENETRGGGGYFSLMPQLTRCYEKVCGMLI